MKKNILYFSILMLLQLPLLAQEGGSAIDSDISLDLLRAPVSPAANLLGITGSQVDQPSDPAAFMASMQAASGNFSGLPASYAVDLAPAWLLAGDKITLDEFLSPAVKKTLAQSLVIGLATNTVEGTADSLPNITRFSAGIKFSIFRGKVSEETKKQFTAARLALHDLVEVYEAAYDSLRKADTRCIYLDSMILAIIRKPDFSFEEKELLTAPFRKQKSLREDSLSAYVRNHLETETFDRARKAAEAIRIRRYGPKLDISAAMAWDFPGMNFDQGQYSTFAAWASGGYELENGLSILALARYINFNGVPVAGTDDLVLYKDTEAFDAGFRVIYGNATGRFSAGLEGIYRKMINMAEMENAWRFTVNAEYEVGRNKKLGVVFGRDFDGTLTGDGELIVALNLLLGFGTGKKL